MDIYTLDQIIHALRTSWPESFNNGEYRDWSDEQEITFRLNDGDAPVFGYDIDTMDARQMTYARLAFELWDDVVALNIREANSGESAEVRFAYTSDSLGNAPATTFTSEEYFGTHLDGADIWMSSNETRLHSASIDFASRGFYTYLHEIGHALGLSHPGTYDSHDDNPDEYAFDAKYTLDTRQYTIMSYFKEGSDGSGADFLSARSAAPMLHDIAAMQAIYGADYTTRTGDTIYGYNSNAGRYIDGLWLNPFDFDQNGKPVFAIWDAGGIDTIDGSRSGYDQFIDLQAGGFSSTNGLTHNIAIAYGVTIENAKGGLLSDVMLGNAAANHLEGGAGNDHLMGLEGNDRLHGGADDDNIYGGLGNDRLIGGEGNDTLLGESDNDVLSGNQGDDFVNGGSGEDFLEGGDGNDRMFGEDGNDTLRGGLGNDWLEGGAGADLLEGYGETVMTVAPEPISVAPSTTSTPTRSPGTLLNAGVLALGSDLVVNEMMQFDGSLTTAQRVMIDDGRLDNVDMAAIDTASYASSRAAVTIDLTNLAANTGDAAGDRYVSIEQFELTGFDDTFVGNNSPFAGSDRVFGLAGNDIFYGNAGDDYLDGGAGNDLFIGSSGADNMFGGDGFDTVSFAAADAGVGIIFGHVNGHTGDAAGDVFVFIERYSLSSFSDTFSGGGNGEYVDGNDGDDTMAGGNGNDTLAGGAGSDTLTGGNGRDVLTGDAGADWFDFNSVAEMGNTRATRDVIEDFAHGVDHIDLSTVDASSLRTGNNAFVWRGSGGFSTSTAGELCYRKFDNAGTDNDYTMVYGDTDGNTASEFQIQLTGLVDLTASDFLF